MTDYRRELGQLQPNHLAAFSRQQLSQHLRVYFSQLHLLVSVSQLLRVYFSQLRLLVFVSQLLGAVKM